MKKISTIDFDFMDYLEREFQLNVKNQSLNLIKLYLNKK